MPNTKSAKKAVRSSLAKKKHNLSWKRKFKDAIKSFKSDLLDKTKDMTALNEKLTLVQKMLDKSAKENVIHANKADRLKSKYAHKLASRVVTTKEPTVKKASAKKSTKKTTKKVKSTKVAKTA